MCQFLSIVITRDRRLLFTEEDSHETIIKRAGLRDDNPYLLFFVRIERTESYTKVDETSIPGWFTLADWQERIDELYARIAPARKRYEETCASARKVYSKTCAPAWKIYSETSAPAWKIYSETSAPAWKVYDAPAWKVYEETCASTLKRYDETRAPAQKRYVETRASAWKLYVSHIRTITGYVEK